MQNSSQAEQRFFGGSRMHRVHSPRRGEVGKGRERGLHPAHASPSPTVAHAPVDLSRRGEVDEPLCTDFGCPDEIENASMNDMSNTPDTPLQRRLASEVKGDILFDAFSRGATPPTPRSTRSCRSARWSPRPWTMPSAPWRSPARSASPSCRAAAAPPSAARRSTSLVVDCSKRLNRILDLDVAGRTVRVEPGIVLDDLNRQLKKHGLWYRSTSPPPRAPRSAA